MKNPPPTYTDQQLKTLGVLERNKMAWIAFIFLLLVFVAIFLLLIYSVFIANVSTWFQVAVFLLDGIIGWSLRTVIRYLFPAPSR